jgi:hypothetical protein
MNWKEQETKRPEGTAKRKTQAQQPIYGPQPLGYKARMLSTNL